MGNFWKIGGSGLDLPELSAAPTSPTNGAMYYDTTLNTVRAYINGTWTDWSTGGGGGSITVVTPGSYPYTASDGEVVLVDTSVARTITLPAPTLNRQVTIKDSIGTASTNNVTIARSAGGVKIEGVAVDKLLQSDWGSFTLVANGTDWFLI